MMFLDIVFDMTLRRSEVLERKLEKREALLKDAR